MTTTNILAIHGAFSTPTIWNYLTLTSPKSYKWHFVDYSTQTSNISNIINEIKTQYKDTNTNFHLIGHSMGGLVALALESETWASSITTIATPLGGLDMSLLQLYLSRSGFLGEIASYSKFIDKIHKAKYTKPVQHIITTQGFNPWMFEPSDGVVSVKSQRSWHADNAIIHNIEANHSEVMMHSQTTKLVANFWNEH